MAWLTSTDPKDRMNLIVSGGGANSQTDLQFAAGLADNQSFAAGALVSYNSSGKIQAGLAAATSMPMWAINGCAEYDAGQFGYNLLKDTEGLGHGVVNTLPASGGYELATTEYNIDDLAGYVKGSGVLTNDTATLGYIKPAPADYSAVTVVGIVSVGIVADARKGINRARVRMGQKKLLRFWTHFELPITEASA
jgi:hypothetical protein